MDPDIQFMRMFRCGPVLIIAVVIGTLVLAGMGVK